MRNNDVLADHIDKMCWPATGLLYLYCQRTINLLKIYHISSEPIFLKNILMHRYNLRYRKVNIKIFFYDSRYDINAGSDNYRSVFYRPVRHYCR